MYTCFLIMQEKSPVRDIGDCQVVMGRCAVQERSSGTDRDREESRQGSLQLKVTGNGVATEERETPSRSRIWQNLGLVGSFVVIFQPGKHRFTKSSNEIFKEVSIFHQFCQVLSPKVDSESRKLAQLHAEPKVMKHIVLSECF